MKHTLFSLIASTPLAIAAVGGTAQAATSTFDDLVLAPNSYYFPGVVGNGSAAFPFTSGSASFNHQFDDFGFAGCCVSGWSYSNQKDTTTAGFGNQYSAYSGNGAGGGQGGSANYAVAFVGPVETSFATPTVVASAYFTNTTYAALSMRDGDGFAKKFGGASGNDADFFKLTISGHNGAASTGSVDFFLADYRFANNTQDYIVSDWTAVNLSALGAVTKLSYTLSSSDNGTFGMNTPAYFGLDTLAPVPEPEQAALLLAGLALIGAIARKRSVAGRLRQLQA